jgi:tRNA pseudouridine38-40 synthase
MVRAIVGTLIEVGRGSRPESWTAEVLAAQERRAAGMTAPAHGLFLVRVEYNGKVEGKRQKAEN